MARPPPATLLETKSLLDGVALGAIATPSNHYELHLGRLLTSARVSRSALSTPRNVYQSTLWWLSVQKDWMRLLITLKSKWYGYFDHFRFEIVLCNIRRSFLSIIDVQPPWEKSTKLPSLRKYLHPTRTHAPPPICHYISNQSEIPFLIHRATKVRWELQLNEFERYFTWARLYVRFERLANLLKIFRLVVSSTIRPCRSRMTELTTNRGAPSSITCYTGADRGGKLRAHLQTRHHPCRHPFLDSGWIGGA